MITSHRITGLMSGSSMDGVDLACCDLEWNGENWTYRILEAITVPYPDKLLSQIQQACNWKMGQIRELDFELGYYYAGLLNEFHNERKLVPDYIASHGHTILHEPDRGITFQAGNGRIMADQTGIPVINDFRREDVQQGGQGAPLVPIGDRLLFSEYEACLNLGGFANISRDNKKGERIAFDLCPANMALNWVAGLEGRTFDRDGKMASQGTVDERLLDQLNQLDYYKVNAPKSLGREWFLEYFLPVIQQSRLAPVNLMSTVLHHIVEQIARGINEGGVSSVLVTGGGAMNNYLIRSLRNSTSASLEIPEESLIHYKEALIFALLGILRIRGEINCLSSVTGGKKNISTGTIHNIKDDSHV